VQPAGIQLPARPKIQARTPLPVQARAQQPSCSLHCQPSSARDPGPRTTSSPSPRPAAPSTAPAQLSPRSRPAHHFQSKPAPSCSLHSASSALIPGPRDSRPESSSSCPAWQHNYWAETQARNLSQLHPKCELWANSKPHKSWP
ncbi:hypothetical protein TIFTF001_049069, partial [Ficus carica]